MYMTSWNMHCGKLHIQLDDIKKTLCIWWILQLGNFMKIIYARKWVSTGSPEWNHGTIHSVYCFFHMT